VHYSGYSVLSTILLSLAVTTVEMCMMVFSEVHDLTLYGPQSTFFPGKCSTRVCGYKQGQENTAEKNSSVKTSVYSLSRSIAACVSSIYCRVSFHYYLIPSPTQSGNETGLNQALIQLSVTCSTVKYKLLYHI